MRLYMNELGLLKSEDGHWSLRQVNDHSWAIQYRTNAHDPWDWSVVDHRPSRQLAMTRLDELQRALG